MAAFRRYIASARLVWLALVCLCLGVTARAAIPYPRHWQSLSSERLCAMGSRFLSAGYPDSAMTCYTIAASRLETQTSPSEKRHSAQAVYLMGHLCLYPYYNYQKAADCLLIAQQAAEELGDSILLADICHDWGHLYLQYETSREGGKLDSTMHYFKRACRLGAKHREYDLFVFNLVTTKLKYSQATDIAAEVSAYLSHHPEPGYVAHLCQAATRADAGDWADAIALLDKSLQSVSGNDDNYHARLSGVMWFLRCVFLDRAGRDTEALSALETYNQIINEHGFKEGIPDYYNQLYHYHSKHGHTPLANEYRIRYFETVDSLTGLTQLSHLTQAPLIFNLQKSAEEMRVTQIQHDNMRRSLLGISLAALVFLAMLVMLYRRNRQLNERNRALYDQSLEQLAIIEEARQAASQAAPQPLPDTEHEVAATDPATEPDTPSEGTDAQVLRDIYQRVKAVMETSPEIYEPSFTLESLHRLVGANTKYISRAIRLHAQCDLRALLSQYRIREACRRMNDREHYGNYTIDAIGKSVGVTSRTSFIENFKKQTGLTPSAYLKLAHEAVAS